MLLYIYACLWMSCDLSLAHGCSTYIPQTRPVAVPHHLITTKRLASRLHVPDSDHCLGTWFLGECIGFVPLSGGISPSMFGD